MTEKEFNEIDPCKEGLKNIAIDMIKYDIKEIKIPNSELPHGRGDTFGT